MRPASYVSCMQCNADLTKKGVKRKRCAGCHSAFYDDVACQKKDWAIHKTECKDLQRRFIVIARLIVPEVDTMAELLAHPRACGVIACCYNNGEYGFEKNPGLGIFWMTQWVKGGDARALFLLGFMYTSDDLVQNKGEEGVKLLQRACAATGKNSLKKVDRIEALCEIGGCYLMGNRVEVNNREAAKWHRLAAEAGSADSQVIIGMMRQSGNGVEKNEEEAMMWFRKSAEQGNAEAQFQLGQLLINNLEQSGETIRADTVEAMEVVKWQRKSAEQGHKGGEYALGVCLKNGDGVAKDPTEAMVWFRKSADQGVAEAQYHVAVLLIDKLEQSGETIRADTVEAMEAVKWYRKSAEQGNEKGEYGLGSCLMDGEGVAKDPTEAMVWFRKSADQGYAPAQFQIGNLLIVKLEQSGETIRADTVEAMEAVKWYRKSAEQGNAEGEYGLGSCLVGGEGVAKDPAEGVVWLRKSADQGDAMAQHELGVCYHHGNGVAADRDEAIRLYRLSADQDDDEGKVALLKLGL